MRCTQQANYAATPESAPNNDMHRSAASGPLKHLRLSHAAPGDVRRWVPRPPSLMSEAVRPTDFVRGAIVGKLNPAGIGDINGRGGIADQPLIPSTRLG
jgi:hypothetical protein